MKKINFKKLEKTLNKSMELYITNNSFVEIEEITDLYDAGKKYGINIKGRYGRLAYSRANVDGDYEACSAYSNNFELELELEMNYDFVGGMFYKLIKSDEKL